MLSYGSAGKRRACQAMYDRLNPRAWDPDLQNSVHWRKPGIISGLLHIIANKQTTSFWNLDATALRSCHGF